jgi:uncharacterized OB-fold protein
VTASEKPRPRIGPDNEPKAWFPAFNDETPYNVVQVELDEGPRLTSRIIGGGDQKIQIGQRVEVVFDDIDEELTLHGFRIVEP